MSNLTKNASRFDFFQAVRLLEQWTGTRLGGEGPAEGEAIRLRPSTSLGFAPADLEKIELTDDPLHRGRKRYRVTARFLGLYGVTSPLPSHYAEGVSGPEPERNRIRHFLDVLHHRLFSLLHRAYRRHHYAFEYSAAGDDDVTRRLLTYIGGDAKTAQSLELARVELLRYASILVSAEHSRSAVEAFLADLLGVPVHVEENMSRTVIIPSDQRSALGQAGHRLSETFVLGTTIEDRSSKIRVRLGPMEHETFEHFLPRGNQLARLDAALSLLSTAKYDYDIELRLLETSVPTWRLGTGQPCRLGYTTFSNRGGVAPVKPYQAVTFQPSI